MLAWLETETGVQIPLHGVCTIGRSPKNTLVLSDERVSRRHALIHSQGEGEHWVVDLGSVNGILLNDRRVKQPTRLLNRDRLEVLGAIFTFRQSADGMDGRPVDHTTLVTARDRERELRWLLVAGREKAGDEDPSLANDELSQIIGGWFLACKMIVEKHDGIINRYLGDGFLAYWPDPHLSETTVAGIIAEFKKLQPTRKPPFRLAIHLGLIAVEKSAVQGEDTLFGNDVDFVFRMESLAAALQQPCLLSEPAAERLKSFGSLLPLGYHQPSGLDVSQPFFGY